MIPESSGFHMIKKLLSFEVKDSGCKNNNELR